MRKEHYGRYCGNVELHGEEPVVLSVTLTECNLPGKFLRQFFNYQTNPAAWSTPFCPEIKDYKWMRLDEFLKMRLIHMRHIHLYRVFHFFFQLLYPPLPYPADLIIHNSLLVKEYLNVPDRELVYGETPVKFISARQLYYYPDYWSEVG